LSGDHRRWGFVDGVDDLGVVDAAEIHRGNGKVRVPELTLNHEQGDTLARHLHRVRVTQLVRREASPHAGTSGCRVELRADLSERPWPPDGRAAKNAEQRADRERRA